MIAEPELVKLAKRVDNDLPDELEVLSFKHFAGGANAGTAAASDHGSDDGFDRNGGDAGSSKQSKNYDGILVGTAPVLSMSFEGIFRHQLLALF